MAADGSEPRFAVAGVARLFADAGTVALVALVSPYLAERAWAAKLHEHAGLVFLEVFLNTPPSQHMVNVLGDLELTRVWEQALEGSADWDQAFDGVQSTADWPGGSYYRELIEVYPEAKVVLSVRDPESWERSMRATILQTLRRDSLVGHLSSAAAHVKPEWRRYELTTEMWTRQGVLDGDGGIRDDATPMG